MTERARQNASRWFLEVSGPILMCALLAVVGCISPRARPTENPGRDSYHDLLVTQSGCSAPPAETLSRAQAQADFRVVERVLRGGYAGFDVLVRGGFDWGGLFQEARTRLDVLSDPMPVEDFRRWLVQTFDKTRDGHLAFWTVSTNGKWRWSSAGSHLDAYTAELILEAQGNAWSVRTSADPAVPKGTTLIGCEGHRLDDLLRPTVAAGHPPTPAWLIVLLSPTPPPPVKCEFRNQNGQTVLRSLGLRRLKASGAKEPADAPSFELSQVTARQVPWLRVRRFPQTDKDGMESFIASATPLRTAPAIVLDVRDNPGGIDNFVRDWFLNLTSHQLKYNTIEELDSDVTLQGSVNWLSCELASKELDPSSRPQIQGDLEAARSALDRAARKVGRPFKDWRIRTPTDKGHATAPYSGSLVVLVNSACASSCESLVMYARQLPGTVVVGENTAGVGVFGEVRPYRLPNSGIWMQAGRKWFHDPVPEKVAEEGTGYLPDIWLDATDPDKIAEALAGCFADEACRTGFEHLRRNARPREGIVVSAISFDGQKLEGDVVNRGNDTIQEIVLEVIFTDADDKAVLTQEFKVVPGGDGSVLPPNIAKHFAYRIDFGGAQPRLAARVRGARVVRATP